MTSDPRVSYLDRKNPSIVQPIESRDAVEGAKFVQTEIVEVVNPKKYPLIFRLYYQPKNQEKTYLGSFSLFPADNPGKFIVATQGKLKNEGSLVLSLEIPDDAAASENLRVGVKRMTFVNE